jgi:TPR repeat protein
MKNICLSQIVILFLGISVFAQLPTPDQFDEIVEKLSAEQIDVFQKLAEKDDSKAQVIVGMMLIEKARSHFREKDRKIDEKIDQTYQEIRLTGFDWLRKASGSGYAPAQYALALASFEIFGCDGYEKELDRAVAADYPAALFKKASELLDPRCGIKRDNQKALEL